ncbi:DUF3052 domain-containing protein [Taklimakanibacter albus]|uniref:DUF3052 domain-containing protein n=1 Tax=Taklimakanibacter albus TaxID=2800327 RepID=A0ACC5RE58_9HYPH|nr:DUF3052 domain-containing protein [Aestuariivirga sp. YIM B02566]MBK1870943.1 DUF3052 domain-containing protein [Aestuariivirga sp. YIM B02566]
MSMAGYSGTPLWKKLGFKPGMKIALIHAPAHYASLMADAPEGLSFGQTAKASDAIHLFIGDTKGLALITKLAVHLPPASMLWVSWPKLSSRLSTGLSENDIRKVALAAGLVDIKVCALDQDWSGLKLTRRKK